MKIALTPPKSLLPSDSGNNIPIPLNSVTTLLDAGRLSMQSNSNNMIFNSSSKFQTLNDILNLSVPLKKRSLYGGGINVDRTLELSLSSPAQGFSVACIKANNYMVYNGMLLSLKEGYPEVMYAILIPRDKKSEVLTEYSLNMALGSRSFDLPEGSMLYENQKLMVVKGIYDQFRLPYKNVVRCMFPKENITSDPQIIKDLVLPKIPRNLSMSQRKALLTKANSMLANLTE